MGFMKPKVPTPPPAPNPATAPIDPFNAEALLGDAGGFGSFRSMIGTSSGGLKRKASTQRTSLIGG